MSTKDENDIQSIVSELADYLDYLEDKRREQRAGNGTIEFFITRSGKIKIKMYQETGHALPHLHVDYSKQNHVASYRLDPPGCIEGKISKSDERVVLFWIEKHKVKLLELWAAAQAGQPVDTLILGIITDDAN